MFSGSFPSLILRHQLAVFENIYRGICFYFVEKINESSAQFRKEKDALGFVDVPIDAYYGAQTRRSMINFPIAVGKDVMPVRSFIAFV